MKHLTLGVLPRIDSLLCLVDGKREDQVSRASSAVNHQATVFLAHLKLNATCTQGFESIHTVVCCWAVGFNALIYRLQALSRCTSEDLWLHEVSICRSTLCFRRLFQQIHRLFCPYYTSQSRLHDMAVLTTFEVYHHCVCSRKCRAMHQSPNCAQRCSLPRVHA